MIWDLPLVARKLAQVKGTIVHHPSFQPVTSRDIKREIYDMDMVRKLVEQYLRIRDNNPHSVEAWLTKVQEDHNTWDKCMVGIPPLSGGQSGFIKYQHLACFNRLARDQVSQAERNIRCCPQGAARRVGLLHPHIRYKTHRPVFQNSPKVS